MTCNTSTRVDYLAPVVMWRTVICGLCLRSQLLSNEAHSNSGAGGDTLNVVTVTWQIVSDI